MYDCPPTVAVTLTFPFLLSLVVAVQVVLELQLTLVAVFVPKVKVVFPAVVLKPVPLIVTVRSVFFFPLFGKMDVMVG